MSLLDPTMFESFRELGLFDKHFGRFQEIWQIYLVNTTDALSQLKQVKETTERSYCMNLLHKIKGSSLNLGLTKLGQFAGGLEQQFKCTGYSLHDSEIELLEGIFQQSKSEMEAKLTEMANDGSGSRQSSPD